MCTYIYIYMYIYMYIGTSCVPVDAQLLSMESSDSVFYQPLVRDMARGHSLVGDEQLGKRNHLWCWICG